MVICAIKDCGNATYKLKKWALDICAIHGINFGIGQCVCDPPFQLFPFPTELKDPEGRKRWAKLVGRKDEATGKNWQPKSHSRVCSVHFVDGCPTGEHPDPSISLGHSAIVPTPRRTMCKHVIEAKPKSEPLQSRENGNTIDSYQHLPDALVDHLPSLCPPDRDPILDHPVPLDHAYSGQCDCSVDCVCPGCYQKQVKINQMQAEIDLLKFNTQHPTSNKSVSRALTNKIVADDEKVRLYTGIPNSSTFERLYLHLLPICRKMHYWRGVGKLSTKVPRLFRKSPKKPGRQRKLSIKDELLLTLMKLRLGLGNDFLADLFGISRTLCSQILNTWIKFLAYELKPLIFWPRKEDIIDKLPEVYHKIAPKLRCIIDCTEFFIDRPRDLELQATTWSDYKKHNTLKCLVAIAPNGSISYLSEAWGGRASDRTIVLESGFLDLIEPTDEVMADRGFPIKSDLVMKRAKLIIPPPGQGAEQMTPESVLKTKQVANVRIHVERAIGRLKYFHILKHTIPITLTPLCNEILTICAALTNLLPPLVN
jgi:hypothetical protein